jgi:cytochrome c
MKAPMLRPSLLAVPAIAAALGFAAPARAQPNDVAELAKASNCMSCHNIDRRVVGPAFKDVAAKYAGQKDAVDKLAQKVINGGSGTWGVLAMPANRQVSEAQAKQLVGWILNQK